MGHYAPHSIVTIIPVYGGTMRRVFSVILAAAALLSLLLVGNVSVVGATAKHDNDSKFSHIFYIMMENHSTNQIFGNTADAPYINQLAGKYATATDFFGVTHPSLPNYLAAISGSYQGIWDDCAAGPTVTCAPQEFVSGPPYNGQLLTPAQLTSATNQPHWFSGKNIIDQLDSHDLSWKAYMQSAPTVGFTGEYYPVDQVNGQSVPRKLYAQKHNPFMYFSDIRNNTHRMQKIVPFTQFDKDLASNRVPNFVWISPDQCHDMHGVSAANAAALNIPDCATPATGLDHKVIGLGDTFVHDTVSRIMQSKAWDSKSAIIVNWDENDYGSFNGCCYSPTGVNGVTLGGGDAPFMVITSKNAHHFVDSTTPYNHYTVLATIEKLWGLGCIENSCDFGDRVLMTKFFE